MGRTSRGFGLALFLFTGMMLGAASDPSELIERAQAEYAQGEYATALKTAKRVLRDHRGHAQATVIAGSASLRLGELDAAEGYFVAVLKHDPDFYSDGLYLQLGYIDLTRAMESKRPLKPRKRERLLKEAAEHFSAESSRSPGNVMALAGRATTLKHLSAGSESWRAQAIDAHEAWIAVDQNAVTAVSALLVLYDRAERFDDGIELLKRRYKDYGARLIAMLYPLVDRLQTEDRAAAIRPLVIHAVQVASAKRGELVRAALAKSRSREAFIAFSRYTRENPPRAELDVVVAVLYPLVTDEDFFNSSEIANRQLISHVKAEYPELALLERLESHVVLQTLVLADGEVRVTHVLISDVRNRGFEQAAIAAVAQWRYEPVRLDGEPVAVFHTVSVKFKLQSK